MKIKFIIPLCIILIMQLSEVLLYNIPYLAYCDEIVACISVVYIIFYLSKNKIKTKDYRFKILLICFAIFCIGLISNLIFEIQKDKFAIFLDMVANFKLPITCIAFSFILDQITSKKIIEIYYKLSKIFIITGAICGVISLFFDIGMRGQERFGIYGFNFIFKYAHIYSMMLFFAIIIISTKIESRKKFFIYVGLVILQLALTTKGISLVSAAFLMFILLYMKKREKINLKVIIILGILGVLLGSYQIQEYFLKSSAPRAVFVKYGIITANEHLPVGTGFATFGSDMAAKYYSSLYEEYGFNSMYGMNSNDTSFLNDNYWPMICGQFGYVGVILVIIILYYFLKIIQNIENDGKMKPTILAALAYMVIASAGTSIFTTSATTIMCLGIIIAIKSIKENKNE